MRKIIVELTITLDGAESFYKKTRPQIVIDSALRNKNSTDWMGIKILADNAEIDKAIPAEYKKEKMTMDVDKLTFEDIDLLLEAIETWKKEKASRAMLTSLLAAGLMEKQEAEEKIEAVCAEAEKDGMQRKRQAVLLEAKLIKIQDSLTVTALFNGAGD